MPARIVMDVQWVPSPVIVASSYFLAAARFHELEEPLERAAKEISEAYETNWSVGGRPAWAPLKESTLERKARGGWPDDILVRTGDLRDEVTSPERWEYDRAGIGHTMAFTAGPVIADYGRFHLPLDMGGSNPDPNSFGMPARNFMDFPDDVEDEVEDKFSRWIDETILVLF